MQLDTLAARVQPGLDEVLAHTGDHTHVALHLSLLADTETPISIHHKLTRGRRSPSFLLESVGGGELIGRYSFIGHGLAERFSYLDGVGTFSGPEGTREVPFRDPLEPIAAWLAARRLWTPRPLPRFHGGAVGFLGFDTTRYFEQVPLPAGREHSQMPEGALLMADELAIYDHFSRRLELVVHAALPADREARVQAFQAALERLADTLSRLEATERPGLMVAPVAVEAPVARSNRSAEDMMAAVRRGKEAIEAGEVFQVVVSQRFTVEAEVAPFTLYRALRALNPSPYMFLLDYGDYAVVGASPEVLVRLEDRELLLRPIAGTRPRGRDEEEERALAAELLADEKELAEHRMLLDLGRNDLGRVAQVGTVRVENPLHLERYSHVMHLVSDVRGRLRPGLDCFDVFRAAFPAGTVSGAPKVRAMELLAELEPDRRGLYAGAVGYFGLNGSMDTCIAIRTLVVEPGQVSIQAGAGIVHDSDPLKEHQECGHKARAGLAALGLALAQPAGGA